MALLSALRTSASGLQATSLRVNSAANNIVNINTDGYQATTVQQNTVRSGAYLGGDTAVMAQLIGTAQPPDLGQAFVRLIEADATYRANAKLFKTVSDISRDTLNTLA